MASNPPEILHDHSPLLRIYSDGRIERLLGTSTVPPSFDPQTNVQSKDVVYSQEHNLSVRLYLPNQTQPNQKLPLLIYFHGGGFCIETAFSPTYHNYLNPLVLEANIVAVSVDYRRAPEDPVPIAFDDSWAALKWVVSHFNGDGPEDWLNSHADFGKVVFAGDSAGGTIAHQMAMRNGQDKLIERHCLGVVLIHPFFWGKEPIENEVVEPLVRSKIEALWMLACPTSSGTDDPLMNPFSDPKLGGLGCCRVLVVVAEKDMLRYRGWYYYENLKKFGWEGEIEGMEAKGEEHVFHLFKPTCENAVAMLKKIASFLNA